jgi:hypothetical protein
MRDPGLSATALFFLPEGIATKKRKVSERLRAMPGHWQNRKGSLQYNCRRLRYRKYFPVVASKSIKLL